LAKEENLRDVVETEVYKGYRIQVIQDLDASDPRKEYDHFGTMVCWHTRYDLGDEHEFADPQAFQEWLKDNPAVVLPLNLYDHSGITMSTSSGYPYNDRWDAGQVGWIYVTLEKVRKEYGKRAVTKRIREDATKALEKEVKTYDQYLRGDVYGYVIKKVVDEDDPDQDKDVDTDHLDSCWGYFGLEYCLSEARKAVKDIYEDVHKTRQDRLKAFIKNRVPLDVRQRELANI
jgi:hypothetical protein